MVVKDGNTVLEENCKSVQLGKSLTINFDASIPGGTITGIMPNIEFTTSGERRKTFTIVGETAEGKEITKEYTVNLNGYYNIPDLKIGDFVKYELSPIDNSKVDTLNSDVNTYSGADNTQILERKKEEIVITENGKDYLLCRVLETDENGNPSKLISSDGVNSLYLNGAKGYNNAVYLIKEMCEVLYSGSQGITTSLTIDDLENNYFNPTALATAKGSNYGKKARYTNSTYTRYPLLATKEKGIGIATDTEEVIEGEGESATTNIYNKVNTSGLGLSEQENLEPGGWSNSSSINNKGITVTNTYYSMSASDNNYKNATLNNIMHKSPEKNGVNNKNVKPYWLASRYVDCISNSNYCSFYIRTVLHTRVDQQYGAYLSGGGSSGDKHAVRPVITLNSGIQAEYSDKYNNTYNIWNLN